MADWNCCICSLTLSDRPAADLLFRTLTRRLSVVDPAVAGQQYRLLRAAWPLAAIVGIDNSRHAPTRRRGPARL